MGGGGSMGGGLWVWISGMGFLSVGLLVKRGFNCARNTLLPPGITAGHPYQERSVRISQPFCAVHPLRPWTGQAPSGAVCGCAKIMRLSRIIIVSNQTNMAL